MKPFRLKHPHLKEPNQAVYGYKENPFTDMVKSETLGEIGSGVSGWVSEGAEIKAGICSTMCNQKFPPWLSANLCKDNSLLSCSEKMQKNNMTLKAYIAKLSRYQQVMEGIEEHLTLSDWCLYCPLWASFSCPGPPFTQSLQSSQRAHLSAHLRRSHHMSLDLVDKWTSSPWAFPWQWNHLSPSTKTCKKLQQPGQLLLLDSCLLMKFLPTSGVKAMRKCK